MKNLYRILIVLVLSFTFTSFSATTQETTKSGSAKIVQTNNNTKSNPANRGNKQQWTNWSKIKDLFK